MILPKTDHAMILIDALVQVEYHQERNVSLINVTKVFLYALKSFYI